MDTLDQRIRGLSESQIAGALDYLSKSLQDEWGNDVDEETARRELECVQTSGKSEELRSLVVSGSSDAAGMGRWGRATLLFAASQPALRPKVEEAVEDASKGESKDLVLGSLIVLGVVMVLIKYRPKTAKLQAGGFSFEGTWEDNDVSAVTDLAKVVASPASPPSTP